MARKLLNRLDAAAVLSWFLVFTGVAIAVGGAGARVWGLEETGPYTAAREVVETVGFYGLFVLPLLAVAVAAVVVDLALRQHRIRAAGVPGPVLLAWKALWIPALVVFISLWWLIEGSAALYGAMAMLAGSLTAVWAVAGVLVFTARGTAARQASGYRTRSHPDGSPPTEWARSAPSRWRYVPFVLVGLPLGITAEGFLLFVVVTALYGS